MEKLKQLSQVYDSINNMAKTAVWTSFLLGQLIPIEQSRNISELFPENKP